MEWDSSCTRVSALLVATKAETNGLGCGQNFTIASPLNWSFDTDKTDCTFRLVQAEEDNIWFLFAFHFPTTYYRAKIEMWIHDKNYGPPRWDLYHGTNAEPILMNPDPLSKLGYLRPGFGDGVIVFNGDVTKLVRITLSRRPEVGGNFPVHFVASIIPLVRDCPPHQEFHTIYAKVDLPLVFSVCTYNATIQPSRRPTSGRINFALNTPYDEKWGTSQRTGIIYNLCDGWSCFRGMKQTFISQTPVLQLQIPIGIGDSRFIRLGGYYYDLLGHPLVNNWTTKQTITIPSFTYSVMTSMNGTNTWNLYCNAKPITYYPLGLKEGNYVIKAKVQFVCDVMEHNPQPLYKMTASFVEGNDVPYPHFKDMEIHLYDSWKSLQEARNLLSYHMFAITIDDNNHIVSLMLQ